MVAQCQRCGSTIASGARYCSSCGETIPPDPNTVVTRELVQVRPIRDPAVSGQGRTRELGPRRGQTGAPTSSGRQAFVWSALLLAFAGVGLVAFLGRHFDAVTPTLGSDSELVDKPVPLVPSAWRLPVRGPAKALADLCGDLEQAAMRRAGTSDVEAFGYACDIDPVVDGIATQSVTNETWNEVHFVRTGEVAGNDKGRVRLGIRTHLGWFLSDPVLSLAAGTGRNEAKELTLSTGDLAPTRGVELSAIASHHFLDPDPATGQADELEQTFQVACALVSGVPDCLRIRTRWRATVLDLAASANTRDLIATASALHPDDPSEGAATKSSGVSAVAIPDGATPTDGDADTRGGELRLAFVNGHIEVAQARSNATSDAEPDPSGTYRWPGP